MSYKIRVQKKKESTPVIIASRSGALIEDLLARPMLIIGSIAVVVLVIAAVFAFRFFDHQTQEAAWAIEEEASKLFHEPPPLPEPVEEGDEEPQEVLLDHQERLKRSAELYEELLEKYPKRAVAVVALFESGNVYYELEAYDKAEERFLSFLEKHQDRKGLAAISHTKLAYLYLKKGDRQQAIRHFRTIYDMADVANKDQAGFELARILEVDEKVDEAMAIYRDVSRTFSESPWGTEAEVRLILLNPPTPPEDTGSEGEEETKEPATDKAEALTQGTMETDEAEKKDEAKE